MCLKSSIAFEILYLSTMNMKLMVAGLLCVLLPPYSYSQNLVGNPSFEEYSMCPSQPGELFKADGWTINVNTSDYFNSCCGCPNILNVPYTGYGYQYPSTGDGFAGFLGLPIGGPATREFLGRALDNPMVLGQKYYVSFKVNFSQNAYTSLCGQDKIGMKFTNVNHGIDTVLNPPFAEDSAHVYTDDIIMDTLNWVTISGSFIADSAYQYMMIGVFFNAADVTLNCVDSTSVFKWNYYYVDDVCVSVDSALCADYPPCIAPDVPIIWSTDSVSCEGEDHNIWNGFGNLNSATNWYWYEDSCGGTLIDSGQLITVSPMTTTTYFMRGEGGCVDPGVCDSFTVYVLPKPTATAAGDTAICLGDSAQLSASGGSAYLWLPGTNLSDASSAAPWASPLTTTLYAVTVVDSNNCSDNASVLITVYPLPVANAGTDTAICLGDSVQLNASGGVSYLWFSTAYLSNDSTGDPWTLPDTNSEYVVAVTSSAGCQSQDSLMISFIPDVALSVAGDTGICSGETVTLWATASDNIIWSTGATTDSIQALLIGDSSFVVTAGNTCYVLVDSIQVSVFPIPTVDAGLDQTQGVDTTLQLAALPPDTGQAYTYLWQPVEGLSCSDCPNPVVSVDVTTEYVLSVTNEWGCTGYDTILITYDPTVVVVLPVLSVYVPDIFSPNGDDSNDWFFIQGKGIESLNLMIFDRWGEKVFENREFQANEESEGWNGKYRGKPVKVGSFKYVVSGMYIDGTKIKKAGDLLLVR